ncbi:MAG: amidohydrolase family protein [Bifidobacteriaceae bacterium]|jgi:predicted TIM-barrel fold metal-dependent hydrolase|nr:amidohydrolase family protein [Bifidobacteriaceae bacterium]
MVVNIIDTHFHIWDLGKQHLPWLDTVDASFRRTFSMDDYVAQYAGRPDVNFIGGIYVDADTDDPLLEDRLLYENNDPHLLATMNRVTISPYMRIPVRATGVRDPLHTDSSPRGRCLEPAFIEGLGALSTKQLIFESCNRADELGDLYDCLVQVPRLTVVLNHLGNPSSLSTGYLSAMRKLASLPNVYCKVSGFPTGDAMFVKELLDFAQDTFAPDHLLYASNWPVVALYSSFQEHLDTVLERFEGDEGFFWKNAAQVYGIDVSGKIK